MGKYKQGQKVIGYCDKCRARLRVGAGTDPENYHIAAASKKWTYIVKPTEGWAYVICSKCNAKHEAEKQGALL